jgi:hypothetical protein
MRDQRVELFLAIRFLSARNVERRRNSSLSDSELLCIVCWYGELVVVPIRLAGSDIA